MKKFSLLLAVLMVLMVVTPVMAETKVDGNQVTFTFKAPNASQVYLSGNFNGWSPTGDKMTKGADGVWSVTIKLKPATYQYKFVADGAWITDESAASFVDDGFGGKNSVLVVRAAGVAADARIDKLEQEIATLKEAQGGFQFHGYARSGMLLNDQGGSYMFNNFANGFILGGSPAKYRLGNEVDTYVELEFAKKITFDNGAWSTFHYMLGHKDGGDTDCEERTPSTESWDATRQVFLEMGDLEFAPELTFWVGKRYYNRADIHLMDWYYRDMSGQGAGVQGINAGPGKLAAAFITKSRPDGAADINNSYLPEIGQYTVKCYDFSYTGIKAGPGNLSFDLALYRGELGDTYPENAKGLYFDTTYNMGTFFGFAEGSSSLVLQYGEGLGQAASVTPWNFPYGDVKAYNESTLNRALAFGVWQFTPEFEMQPLIAYQKTETPSDATTYYTVGARPIYHFSKNFALQFEAGYQNIKADSASEASSIMQLSIAPTFTLDLGFYTRPQLRAFVTYADWKNNGWVGDWKVNTDPDGDGLNYGFQFEYWW